MVGVEKVGAGNENAGLQQAEDGKPALLGSPCSGLSEPLRVAICFCRDAWPSFSASWVPVFLAFALLLFWSCGLQNSVAARESKITSVL